MTTSSEPTISDMVSFSIDISIKVAGRKIVVSISTSGRPGRKASSAFSTSRVTCSVLPQGNFSTIAEGRPVVDDPVADHRLMIDDHVGHVLQIQLLPFRTTMRHVGQGVGLDIV